MDFLHQIKLSFSFYLRAFRFIDNNNIWKLLIVPAIINLMIAALIIIFAIRTSGIIVEYVLTSFQPTNGDASIQSFIEGFLMVVVRAGVFFLYLKVYRYLALICLTPSFAIISSKIHIIDSGEANTLCTSKYLLFCSRGMKIAVRNFILEITLSTLVIILAILITWLIPIVPIAILLLESYFMGFSMADYRNEYYKMNLKESTRLMHQYLGLVIGNGLAFNLFLVIPIVGILFAPTFALIASGLSINYLEKRKNILCNSDQSTLMMAES